MWGASKAKSTKQELPSGIHQKKRKQVAEECSEGTKTSQCPVSGLQVKALPRAAGRTKPWDSRLLCFVKVAKHLVNEAANCRRWEVGLLEEAAGCTPGPASAMEHS